jgi:hypothetical protein
MWLMLNDAFCCADTKSTFIVLALKLPLERNIHSVPQPAGPVKVANGGHLSGNHAS